MAGDALPVRISPFSFLFSSHILPDTAFKQQRLKAWQPILTPKTVLPTLFIIGFIFAPIGGLLIWGSGLVSEMTFDYTDCEKLTPTTNETSNFTPLPSNKYSYRLRAGNDKLSIQPPRYAFLDNTNNDTFTDVNNKRQCILEFHVPIELKPSVFFYYKLTNFYQNHRRYVKSLNSDQLKGKYVSPSSLDNSDCDPLGSINGTAIYPCGLIANSLFNGWSLFLSSELIRLSPRIDTFYTPMLMNAQDNPDPQPYAFSNKGIAWSGEAKKYVRTPIRDGGYSSVSEIVPPPNWKLRFPDNYTEDNIPDLSTDEHFQNWMRTAGLPTFTKLYGRNDDDTMRPGIYRVVIGLSGYSIHH